MILSTSFVFNKSDFVLFTSITSIETLFKFIYSFTMQSNPKSRSSCINIDIFIHNKYISKIYKWEFLLIIVKIRTNTCKNMLCIFLIVKPTCNPTSKMIMFRTITNVLTKILDNKLFHILYNLN